MRTNYYMVDDIGSRFIVFADEVKVYYYPKDNSFRLLMNDGRFVHFVFDSNDRANHYFYSMVEWFGK